MNQFNTFGMQDIIILGVSLCVGIIFAMFFADKLFKFYLGIIVGFLLFIAFNSQINLLENLYGRELSSFQNFLVKNKGGILNTLSIFIPILGLLFVTNPFKKGGLWASLILGSLVPLFLIGMLLYVIKNSIVGLPFLENLIGFLDNSFLVNFLQDNLQYTFLVLLFLLFYKYIFALIWAFALWLFDTIRVAFFGEREKHEESHDEDDQYEDEYEDEDDDEHH